MTRSPVPTAGYDNAQTLNDIHAVLASPSRPASVDAPRDIASILARAGRLPQPRRIITAVAGDDANSVPAALIDADGTDACTMPKGPGLLIHVTLCHQVDAEALKMSVVGTVIRQPSPHGGRP